MVIHLFILLTTGYITIPLQRNKRNLPLTSPKKLFNQTLYQELFVQQSLQNFMNVQYKGFITIGSKSQVFEVIFDTGSSWTWVNSASCRNCHSSSSNFNPKSSTTYKSLKKTIQQAYGSGSIEGILSTETIGIGSPSIQAKKQPFLLVVSNENFENLQADGILGLGFRQLSQGKITFIQNLQKQKVIKHAVFSVFLDDNDFLEASTGSVITIGGFDVQKYGNGQIQYSSVYAQTGYWAIQLNSVQLDKNYLEFSTVAIADTGTSLIITSQQNLNNIYNFFYMNFGCGIVDTFLICDCFKGVQEFPVLKFELETGKVLKIGPEDYFYDFYGECQLLMQSAGYLDIWILGDVFLRRYYTVYDMDNERIGFSEVGVKKSSSFGMMVIIGASLLLIGIGAILLRYALKKSSKNQNGFDYQAIQSVN